MEYFSSDLSCSEVACCGEHSWKHEHMKSSSGAAAFADFMFRKVLGLFDEIGGDITCVWCCVGPRLAPKAICLNTTIPWGGSGVIFPSKVFHTMTLLLGFIFFVSRSFPWLCFFQLMRGKNMLDDCLFPRHMMSGVQWWRPEMNVSSQPTCRYTVTSATVAFYAEVLLQSSFFLCRSTCLTSMGHTMRWLCYRTLFQKSVDHFMSYDRSSVKYGYTLQEDTWLWDEFYRNTSTSIMSLDTG